LGPCRPIIGPNWVKITPGTLRSWKSPAPLTLLQHLSYEKTLKGMGGSSHALLLHAELIGRLRRDSFWGLQTRPLMSIRGLLGGCKRNVRLPQTRGTTRVVSMSAAGDILKRKTLTFEAVTRLWWETEIPQRSKGNGSISSWLWVSNQRSGVGVSLPPQNSKMWQGPSPPGPGPVAWEGKCGGFLQEGKSTEPCGQLQQGTCKDGRGGRPLGRDKSQES